MVTILRWLVSKSGWLVLSFVIIVLLLAAWHDLPAEVRNWRTEADNVRNVAKILDDRSSFFNRAAQDSMQKADNEISKLQRASSAQLNKAKKDIEKRQSEAQALVLDDKGIALAALTGEANKITASYQAKYIDLPLLKRADELVKLRQSDLRKHFKQKNQIGAFNKEVKSARAALNRSVKQRNIWMRQAKAELRYPGCRRFPDLLGCELVRKINAADKKLRIDRVKLKQKENTLSGMRSAMKALKFGNAQVFSGKQFIEEVTVAYADKVRSLSEDVDSHIINKAKAAFEHYWWTALTILIGAVFLPILHKLFAYVIIAPFAARALPVRLHGPGPQLLASASGMSVDVAIHPNTELLLRSGLQSSNDKISGSDKFVLDWHMPLTCVAAGLVNLQRLRTDQPDHVSVTGSDEYHRVVTVTVPVGGAVVVQPRALLGVVKTRGTPLVIERPWRMRWLISWITGQFRYVVFHGPCTLIVQGRGGVQFENAVRGRMINKRLTLGFDASVAYGATRSSSFGPYWRGEESLFNDRFQGAGNYFYEQHKAGAGKGSFWGRGFKGIGDAALSALGI